MKHRWVAMVILIVALLFLWQGVFYSTGLAGAKAAPAKVARPGPVALPEAKTDWVDMNVWQHTHPVWWPDD